MDIVDGIVVSLHTRKYQAHTNKRTAAHLSYIGLALLIMINTL